MILGAKTLVALSCLMVVYMCLMKPAIYTFAASAEPKIEMEHIGIIEKHRKQAQILVCITLCACAITVLHEQWISMCLGCRGTPTSQVLV